MKILLALLVFLFAAPAFAQVSPIPSNQFTASPPGLTYYVSSAGNDASNGLSVATAWQTIGKVNSSTFGANTIVLFQGGATFTGCLTITPTQVPGRGVNGASFTVGSFGPSHAIISANCTGATSAAVTIDGVSNVTVQDLTTVGAGVPNTQYGVLIVDNDGLGIRNIMIKDNDISNNAHFEVGVYGIGLTSGKTGNLDKVAIVNNKLHGTTVTSTDLAGIDGYSANNTPNGRVNITNVVYSGNEVYNIGGIVGSNSTAGILLNNVYGGVAEFNKVHDIGANSLSCGGMSAIFAWESVDVHIRYNEAYNIQPFPAFVSGCDWIAYDLDGGVSNSEIAYNYAHDNFGGGLLAYVADEAVGGTIGTMVWSNNTFHDNISDNSTMGVAVATGGFAEFGVGGASAILNSGVYNNTFFSNTAVHVGVTYACFSEGSQALNGGGGSFYKNNICELTATSGGIQPIYDPYGTSVTFTNNQWYAPNSTGGLYWRIAGNFWSFAQYQAGGYGANDKYSNPSFSSVPVGGCTWTPSTYSGPQPCPAGYALNGGAPGLGAGAVIAGRTHNYFGGPIPSPPNMGAY